MQTLKKGNPANTVEAKKKQAQLDRKASLEHINNIDPRLAKTFYAIEADSYASHMIWKEYYYDVIPVNRKYEFVQDSSGFSIEIGKINKRPIVLTFRWWVINGHPVLFYDCGSQLADWKMIEDWLAKYMPHLKYTSDAMNAHNVLNYCEKKVEKPAVKKTPNCWTCNDSKQVEVRRIGYDSIMGRCPNCS